jgi:hypothetical protein
MKISVVWEKGAESAQIACAHNNWRAQNLIPNDARNAWEVQIDFLSGRNLFKFIIDGEWECSDKYHKIDFSGVENNFIDVGSKRVEIV